MTRKKKVKVVLFTGHNGKWKYWRHRQKCTECAVVWAFSQVAKAMLKPS